MKLRMSIRSAPPLLPSLASITAHGTNGSSAINLFESATRAVSDDCIDRQTINPTARRRMGGGVIMKAIAFCGLACCVCSENQGCVGCQDGGCESHGWCKNYNLLQRKRAERLLGMCRTFHAPAECSINHVSAPLQKFARRYGVDELREMPP